MLVVGVSLNWMSPLAFQTSTEQIRVTNDVIIAKWPHSHPVIFWLHFQREEKILRALGLYQTRKKIK